MKIAAHAIEQAQQHGQIFPAALILVTSRAARTLFGM
jgi:hypothetical protein